jgi:agmatinase
MRSYQHSGVDSKVTPISKNRIIMPHFLDIPSSVARSRKSPYALLPIPYEHSTSFGKGTKRGPAALIRASQEIDTVDEELLLPINVPIQTRPSLKVAGKTPAAALQAIYRSAQALHKTGTFVLGVGGEHSVSLPLIKAASENHRGLSVLQFDAHLDLRDKYSGTKYSHASVMRRVLDLDIPVVHAGIRSLCEEELDLVRTRELPVFFSRYMIEKAAKTVAAQICRQLTQNVYISFDVDVLDPSIMPGTGTPEPGGLDWHLTIDILREVIKRKNVVSADIVELSPIKDSNVSEYTAARLAQKLVTYHWHRREL